MGFQRDDFGQAGQEAIALVLQFERRQPPCPQRRDLAVEGVKPRKARVERRCVAGNRGIGRQTPGLNLTPELVEAVGQPARRRFDRGKPAVEIRPVGRRDQRGGEPGERIGEAAGRIRQPDRLFDRGPEGEAPPAARNSSVRAGSTCRVTPATRTPPPEPPSDAAVSCRLRTAWPGVWALAMLPDATWMARDAAARPEPALASAMVRLMSRSAQRRQRLMLVVSCSISSTVWMTLAFDE
jgi:hypothetical protein